MALLLQETQRFDPVHQFFIWGGLRYIEDCKNPHSCFELTKYYLRVKW